MKRLRDREILLDLGRRRWGTSLAVEVAERKREEEFPRSSETSWAKRKDFGLASPTRKGRSKDLEGGENNPSRRRREPFLGSSIVEIEWDEDREERH